MKNNLIRMFAALMLLTLCLESFSAQGPVQPQINEELSKQETIYRSQGESTPDGYTIDRSLAIYANALSTGFARTLAALGPNDRWLDIGAGMGQAILDYYTPGKDLTSTAGLEQRGKKARAVAISIEDRRTPLWRQTAASLEENKIRYLFNKRLREYSQDDLGKFQIITDVIGGFSYVSDLSLFMEKALGFLELNGSFYTVLQDVSSEAGTNQPYYKGAPYLTEIKKMDGAEVNVCSWLKSISCVEVSCELKSSWKPPVESFRIRKVCNDVNVPALLPTHFQAGTPPERRFQLPN